MSEKPEETDASFKPLDTPKAENLLSDGRKVKTANRKKLLVSFSSNTDDANYSIENKENDSKNIINNARIERDDISALGGEPKAVLESENPNILLQEHSNYKYTWPWLDQNLKVCKLPEEQLSPVLSGNSSSVSNCSGNSYVEALKPNILSNHNIEMNNQLKNAKENILTKEVNTPIGECENPFGVIGRNVVDRKKLSEFQKDSLCNLNEENILIKAAFQHVPFKIDPPDVDIEHLNYLDEKTKGLSIHENCYRNEFSNENNLWREYLHETDTLNVVEFDSVFTKATDRQLESHIPKLSDSNETYIDECVKSSSALLKTLNFIYPPNINWNGDSSDGTCIELLRKDISSSNKDTRMDSIPEHNCYTSQVEVIPSEYVEDSSSSPMFLSNALRICGKKCESEYPVFFIPLDGGLEQDAEAQETNLMTSPTHIAIESELCELWKEKSQKSVDKGSNNAIHSDDQDPNHEDKHNVQRKTEDSQFCKEDQRFLNGSAEVKAPSLSDSSTVITSCSSLISMTEKGFNYTNATNHPNERVSDASAQIINDRHSVTTSNLASVLNETSNILLDYDSSYVFYKSVRNEVNQEIEDINQRISIISDALNL